MLRLEARNSQVPIERKPPWIKTRLRTGPSYTELKSLVRSEGLHTVSEEAEGLGFAGVMSGPLVRSSYRAGRLYAQAIEQRAGRI